MEQSNEEIWKDIPGWEGLYQVSNHARIKSLPHRKKRGCFLKSNDLNGLGGYDIVTLTKTIDGCKVRKGCLLHRLVAIAFVPNPNGLPEVNHIDGIKKNNSLSNLEWVTASQNMQHAYRIGLRKIPRGAKHHKAKLNESDVLSIRKSGLTRKELSKKFAVSTSTIDSVLSGRNWKHLTSDSPISEL